MKHTTSRRTASVAVGVILASILLAGCSSVPSGDQTSAGSGGDSDRWLTFADCMRSRGHEMSDSDRQLKIDQSDSAYLNDVESCQQKAGIEGTAPTTSAADAEKELAFAKCMRENGVSDYPDPGAGEPVRYDGAHVDAFNDASPTCNELVYGDLGGTMQRPGGGS
jgi:hypothetical protein